MIYCQQTTENHSICINYPTCRQDVNNLIVDEGYNGLLPLFTNRETVIDLDLAEEFVANSENRDLNKSMDMAFGVTTNSGYKKMIMVELKLNYEKEPNNLSRESLEGKVEGSLKILGNEVEVHDRYFIVVRIDNIEHARSRLARMMPPIDPRFIPMDMNMLKTSYFN